MHIQIVSVVSQFVALSKIFLWMKKFMQSFEDTHSMHFVQIFIFVWLLYCTAVASYFRAYVIWIKLSVMCFFRNFLYYFMNHMLYMCGTLDIHNFFFMMKMHFYVHFYLTFDCYSAAVAVCVFCHCHWMDVKLIFHYWNFFHSSSWNEFVYILHWSANKREKNTYW